VKGLPSVTTEILQPRTFLIAVRSTCALGCERAEDYGTELEAKLDAGTPRIMIGGGTGTRPDRMAKCVTIMPYMMATGEAEIVANAIYEGLTKPGSYQNPVIPQGQTAQLGGTCR